MIIGEVIGEASFDSFEQDHYDYLFKNRKKSAHKKHSGHKHPFKPFGKDSVADHVVEFGKDHLILRNFGLKPAHTTNDQISGTATADQQTADQSENLNSGNQQEQSSTGVKETFNQHPTVNDPDGQSDQVTDKNDEKDVKEDPSYSYQFDSFDTAKTSNETPLKKDPAPEKKKDAFGSAFGWICLGITVVLVAVVVKSIEEHHHSSAAFTKKRYTL